MASLNVIKEDQGFTLVEVAIVLVIIGLILGAVIKGRALVHNAKVKNVINQVDGIRTGVHTFYDRYGQYPGDENLQNIPDGDTAGVGNGDGRIEQGNEERDLFMDLALSGIISGDYDGTKLPRHAYGHQVRLLWISPPGGTYNHWFTLSNLPWDVAMEVDLKLDDGDPETGSVMANEAYEKTSGPIERTYILF